MAENPGVVQMADIAHLLALLFSAQHKGEEALSIVELYLIDYPDNLNLLITRWVVWQHHPLHHQASIGDL